MKFKKPHPAFKVWLETEEGYVFGPGVYSLLKKIEETGTLKEAAGSLDMSYRYAWGLVKQAEQHLGSPLLDAHKGGRKGGGGTKITELGRQFIKDFTNLIEQINQLGKTSFEGILTETSDEGKTIEVEILEKPLKLPEGTRLIFIPFPGPEKPDDPPRLQQPPSKKLRNKSLHEKENEL